jgi:putative heme-binding domain-containing protein
MRFIALLITTAAVLAFARSADAQHATPFDIEDGERAFERSCANCHGPDGNLIEGIDFGRGIFRRQLSDDEIIAVMLNGIPDTPMPATPSMSEEQARRIVSYLRAWAEEGRVSVTGDPDHGRSLFFGEGNCDSCHSVNGRGARHGPDLSQIGRERRAAELQASLLDPDFTVQPTARSYRVTLANGDEVAGRLLNHDSFTVQLIDSDDKLRSFIKSDLKAFGFIDTPMPAYGDKFSDEDITDLVSYLASLLGESDD